MRSRARWAGGLAIGLVLLVVATAGAAWWLIESLDLKQVVARVESALQDVTGRTLTIGSQPRLSFTPLLMLVVRDVTLGNMKGGTRAEMLKLERLEIGISLAPLLEGRRPGLNIAFIEPDLLLEVSERGERNWDLKLSWEEALARLKEAVAILEGRISLDSVRIERASLRYEDRRDVRKMTLTARRAVLELKKDDEYGFDLDAALNGKAAAMHAEFRSPGAGESLSARINASLGRSTLSGDIEVIRFAPRPQIRATLEAPVLDLGELLGAGGAAGAARTTPPGDGRVFPATKFPLVALHSLDAEAQLKAGRLVLPGNRTLEQLQAHLSLANGRLSVAPLAFGAGGGQGSGQLRVDAAAANTATIEAELQMKGVELDRLFRFAGLDAGEFKGARTDMAIGLVTNGDSLRAWMAGLNGQARVVVGEGRLPGKRANWSNNVVGQAVNAATPDSPSEDGASFKCVVINVPVRRGVVEIKDTVAAETDKAVGAVSGSVDLGQERLDLVLHSQSVKGVGLADFASAAKLTGTFARPELAVNAKGAAVAGLRVGAAIATAGISVLAASAARKENPLQPCQAALAKSPN